MRTRIVIGKVTAQERVIAMRHQMGDYAFVRFMRNLGIDFEDAYFYMFGRAPRK